jgi:hypothetical protein
MSDMSEMTPDTYWHAVEQRREDAQQFINNPTRGNLKKLTSNMWTLQAYGDINYYLSEHALDGQTPDEIAETINEAIRADNPELVNELTGFRWATTSEILRALEPETYAILNKRAISGMKALSYNPPNNRSAGSGQYAEFVDEVKEAANEYHLRAVAQETHGAIPDSIDISRLEAADGAFTAHYAGELNLEELSADNTPQRSDELIEEVREEVNGKDQYVGQLSDELMEEVREEVNEDPRYRDVLDFLYSAVRNELDRN